MRIAPILLTLLLSGCATDQAGRSSSLAIGQIQGNGTLSAYAGQQVQVEGVVSADMREGLGGFFLQDAGDGDASTSDALFVVSSPEAGAPAAPGTRLRVRGRVVELGEGKAHASLTALEPVQVRALGFGQVAAVSLQAPPPDWEALEGMRVRIDAPLTISGTHALPRAGELTAAFEGRLWQPSELARPGSVRFAQRVADNARRRLLLDDASTRRDPGRAWYLGDQPTPRVGSTVVGAEGIVDQRMGHYRLQLLAAPQVRPAARPPVPTVAGNLRVAVLNLENLFNGDGAGGGFPTPRGARDAAELAAQLRKLVETLHALDPDIAALMELENDGHGPQSSIRALTDALNAAGGDWRPVHTSSRPGGDEIRVAMLYRRSRVSTVGTPAMLRAGPFGQGSRVPLAQAFRRGQGPAFVVVANHFKSKGCSNASGGDADQGDGQACWNALRVESARRLHAWLQGDPTGTGSRLQLIVGDLNAYAMEDPVRLLVDAGWRDALGPVAGLPAYSYVYDGLSGRLDHALLSPELAPRLRGAAEWHSNADEPDSAGYAVDNVPGPWRSSDHDPLLLGLDL